MLRSMTGYGKNEFSSEGLSILIEIRSLNSKVFDLNSKSALLFREKENEIRTLISDRLIRGKIDFTLTIEKRESSAVAFNRELAKQYAGIFSEMARECGIASSSDLLVQALKMPDVIVNEQEEISETFWKQLCQGIRKACDELDAFRQSEGLALEKDMMERIHLIERYIDQITPWEKNRAESVRAKFMAGFVEISMEYDKNRLEEELIYYIEKMDITEEKVRLGKHCGFFIETILSSGESPGKKLGFILQEMGREINTLGAKAGDFQIQQVVVNMKDELEKIKEQVANIL